MVGSLLVYDTGEYNFPILPVPGREVARGGGLSRQQMGVLVAQRVRLHLRLYGTFLCCVFLLHFLGEPHSSTIELN